MCSKFSFRFKTLPILLVSQIHYPDYRPSPAASSVSFVKKWVGKPDHELPRQFSETDSLIWSYLYSCSVYFIYMSQFCYRQVYWYMTTRQGQVLKMVDCSIHIVSAWTTVTVMYRKSLNWLQVVSARFTGFDSVSQPGQVGRLTQNSAGSRFTKWTYHYAQVQVIIYPHYAMVVTSA